MVKVYIEKQTRDTQRAFQLNVTEMVYSTGNIQLAHIWSNARV